MAISPRCIEDEAWTPRSGNHGVNERPTHGEQDTVSNTESVNRENTSSTRQIVYILCLAPHPSSTTSSRTIIDTLRRRLTDCQPIAEELANTSTEQDRDDDISIVVHGKQHEDVGEPESDGM